MGESRFKLMSVDQRPRTVIVVAAFLFAATAIAALAGISLLFSNPLLNRMWRLNQPGAVFFHSIGRISGFFLLALGGGTFAAALGLLHGRRWAWWFAAALFVIEVAGNMVSYFLVHDGWRAMVGILVSSIFLYMLFRPSVRDYFARPAQNLAGRK